MKICKKCQKYKNIEDFPKKKDSKDGKHSLCKLCINQRNTEYRKRNSESVKLARKKNYQKNIHKMRAEKIAYYKSHKQEKAKYDIEYRQNNKDKIRQYKINWHEKNKNNIIYKIKRNLRRRIHHVIKDGYKSDTTMNLLGCSIEGFIAHIESLFQDGMSWENYGQYGWHIDHIKPCSSFDLSDPEQQKLCFHYSNQRPLWWIDNLKKGRSIE